jgi:hypothetical protein
MSDNAILFMVTSVRPSAAILASAPHLSVGR